MPLDSAPAVIPLSLLDEGHTGVALFMVLSGYLFAKLLENNRVIYTAFLWNRALRLLPLLSVVLVIEGFVRYYSGGDIYGYIKSIVKGVVYPYLPNGGWSITAEAHFYLLLPLLLYLSRRSVLLPVTVVLAAIALRAWLLTLRGEVQTLAYWTIVGRIDQFVFGIVAFHLSTWISEKRRLLVLIWTGFIVFWWWFDFSGGIYKRPAYPSPSALWVVIPTIEGIAYGSFIAWYDNCNFDVKNPFSRIIQKYGEYSYSIYLLHFFVVSKVSHFIHAHVMTISNIYVAIPWAMLFFMLMLLPAYLSFRFIESPFLAWRKRYVHP